MSLHEYQRTKKLEAFAAQNFTALTAQHLAKPIALDNQTALRATLDTILTTHAEWLGDTLNICIYSSGGKLQPLLTAFNASCPDRSSSLSAHPNNFNNPLGGRINDEWYSAPMSINSRQVGTLWVKWPNTTLWHWFSQRTGVISALSLLLLLLTLWIKQYTRSHVTKPLEEITLFLESAARKKNFSRLPKTPDTATMRPLRDAIAALLHTVRQHQGRLKQIAFNDPLTNLPNRRHFWEYLTISLHNHKRTQRPLALMLIDLDGFKAVNDQQGHEIGDELLTQVSRAIRTCIRQEDFLARLGGDEFTLILRDCDDPNTAKRIAQKITKALDHAFTIGDEDIRVGASIGIALAPADSKDPKELIRFADKAMYAAKRQKDRRYAFWQEAMNQLCDNLALDETLILKALNEDALKIELILQHLFTQQRPVIGALAYATFRHADSAQILAGQQLARTVEEVIMQSDSPKLLLRYHEWLFQTLSEHIQHWKKNPALADALLPITLQLAPHKLQLSCFVHALKEAINQGKLSTDDVMIQMHEDTLNRLHHLPIASLADPINQLFFSQLQVTLVIDELTDAYTILNKAPNVLVKRLQFSALQHTTAQLKTNALKPGMTSTEGLTTNSAVKNIFKFAQDFGCDICITHIDEASTWHDYRKLGATIGQGSFLSCSANTESVETLLAKQAEGPPLTTSE
jgi:diguanylate cyclase (GGDEF)-like protein